MMNYELMALHHYAADQKETLEAPDALYNTFCEFIAFSMNHTNSEALVLNKLLWRHYSDEEIYIIHRTISVSIPPDKVTVHGRWGMRGMSNTEIITWLLSYHGSRPEAFQFLVQLAEYELPEERWNNVREALCEAERLPSGCVN